MRTLIKKVCTLKAPVGTRAIDNYERWKCGCVKCVEELAKAGWATSKTAKESL